MAAFIVDHNTGARFDYDAVLPTPFRFVPGTQYPLDEACVNFYYPEPANTDPRADEKRQFRAELLKDVAIYQAAADAARA